MDVRELRIGSIIRQGRIDYIEANDQTLIFLRCNGRIVENPEPEKLSEEWLDRVLSYEDDTNHETFGKWSLPGVDGWPIDISKVDGRFVLCVNTEYQIAEVAYVHELQDLYLAFTRKELEIK